jgi:rhomboid protease GluP
MRGSHRPDLGTGGIPELFDRYPVTFGVLGANLLLFLFVLSKASGGDITTGLLGQLGANDYRYVFQQPWRLITCAFLHYGVLHFVLNGVALYIVGKVLEVHYGWARLWTLYVVFAVASSLASASWNALLGSGVLPFGGAPAVSAGASGAIYGLILLGYVYARGERHRLGSIAASLQNWIIIGALFTFVFPGIDVAGHVGGAAAGALGGMLVKPEPGKDPHPAWKPVAIGLAFLCLAAFGMVMLTLRASR